MKKNHYLIFLAIVLCAVFFYSYNLHHTYLFCGDMARDSLQALRILKEKKITVIGPPLSFGQFGFREIYFGSLTYYLGAIGLIISNYNVLGPIYINILIMIVGLFFFFQLAFDYFKKPKHAIIATFLYALSPAIVIHMRFYWNPNFLISIAPIFWYFYYQTKSKKNHSGFFSLLTGFFGAILINLHYFVAPIIIFVFFILFKTKNKKKPLLFAIGLILGLLPLILFELKNNFYLTQAIYFNLIKNRSYHFAYQPIFVQPWYIKLTNLFRIILIFLGLDYEVTYIPILFKLEYWQKIALGILVFLLLVYQKVKKKIKIGDDFVFYLFFCAFITTALSHEEFYLRYFFICLPLLVLTIYKIFNQFYLVVLTAIVFFLINFRILYFQAHNFNHKYPFPQLSQIEKAIEFVKKDSIKPPYNITENFIGDARALYLRFFLEKDPLIPRANDELGYNDLNTLYVFAPNLNVVLQENRWEFTATPNLKLVKTYKIEENSYLFKFVRED